MKKCIDYYGDLFEYAKGYLSTEERADIQAHLATCTECAYIASSLAALWPYLQQELNEAGYMNYFSIAYSVAGGQELQELAYAGHNAELPESMVAQANEILEKTGGVVPEGEHWMGSGYDKGVKLLSNYANEGGRVTFEAFPDPESPNHMRTRAITLPKLHTLYWGYMAFLRPNATQIVQSKDAPNLYVQSKDAPNLYEGGHSNRLGQAAKCALFVPLPAGATNIRIKKGSGVLTCGEYKIAYSQRFASEDENMDLRFTFNM